MQHDDNYSDIQDVPAEAIEAIATVYGLAWARNGQWPGCTVFTAWVAYDRLVQALPQFRARSFASPEERRRVLVEFVASKKTNAVLPIVVLTTLGQEAGQHVARRALDTMLGDEREGRQPRRPVSYVLPLDEGLAVALALDDRFWDYETW